jgi:hypothetical protein
MIAAVLRELITAGLEGEQLVAAIERIEGQIEPRRSVGAMRTARWRERHKASQSVTSVTCDAKEIPPTPPKENKLPPEPTEDDLSYLEIRGFPRDRHPLESEKFKNHWLASSGTNAVKRDWHRAYRNWCLRSLEMGGPGPVFPASASGVTTIGFYAAMGSPELDAWTDHMMKTKGRSPPRDKNGGWTFPAQWPPDYQPQQLQAAE